MFRLSAKFIQRIGLFMTPFEKELETAEGNALAIRASRTKE